MLTNNKFKSLIFNFGKEIFKFWEVINSTKAYFMEEKNKLLLH